MRNISTCSWHRTLSMYMHMRNVLVWTLAMYDKDISSTISCSGSVYFCRAKKQIFPMLQYLLEQFWATHILKVFSQFSMEKLVAYREMKRRYTASILEISKSQFWKTFMKMAKNHIWLNLHDNEKYFHM